MAEDGLRITAPENPSSQQLAGMYTVTVGGKPLAGVSRAVVTFDPEDMVRAELTVVAGVGDMSILPADVTVIVADAGLRERLRRLGARWVGGVEQGPYDYARGLLDALDE